MHTTRASFNTLILTAPEDLTKYLCASPAISKLMEMRFKPLTPKTEQIEALCCRDVMFSRRSSDANAGHRNDKLRPQVYGMDARKHRLAISNLSCYYEDVSETCG